jgi:predicted PurR-regulated permease PerM
MTVETAEPASATAGPEESTRQTTRSPRLPRLPIDIRSLALSLIAVAVVILLLQHMQAVLIPFVLAALMFYALDPAVDRMQAWHVPRAVGAALMIFIVVASVLGLVYFLQDDAAAMVERLPQGIQRARDQLRSGRGDPPGMLDNVEAAAKEFETPSGKPLQNKQTASGATRVQVEAPAFSASQYLWSGSVGALNAMNQGIMVLFLTYFMLLSNDLYKRKLIEMAGPTLARKKVTVKILEDIAGQIERFLVIQAVTSVLVAVATGLALWSMGLEDAAFWGFLAGVFNTIPYYGPLIVTGGLSIVAFLQFGTVSMTAAVAGVALFITTLEGSILTPSLMGRVAEMNNVAVFVGLLFWSWMWGVPGMLLAVPLMMIIKAVCDGIEDLHPIGRFLGE